ncbi:MAG: alpha-ketoglutarate-dependent dioxygenase AlkB [Verrucomicrobiota bacterium]
MEKESWESAGFLRHLLGSSHSLWEGRLPEELLEVFSLEELWRLHPETFHEVRMHGRWVKTPRWQQAFERDYAYTGSLNRSLPLPPFLRPLLDWIRETLFAANGVLMNWYDGALGHYIGPHRDTPNQLEEGRPIVTVSFGEERTFRLRPWKEAGNVDFPACHGTVFLLPYCTNQAYTHEVPRFRRQQGRRVSVTFRQFRS